MTYDYTVYYLVYDFIVEFIGYACLCILSVVLRYVFPHAPKKSEIKTISQLHLDSFLCFAGVSTQEEDTMNKVITG